VTYQEKKSIVSLISVVLIFASYCLYMYPRHPGGGLESAETLRYWGLFVLILILVSIAANIVIHIVFSIVHRMTSDEQEPTFADELDKLIDLKSMRNSFLVFMIGFVLAMAALTVELPPQTMFIVMISAGFLSEVANSVTKLYHYRKGV